MDFPMFFGFPIGRCVVRQGLAKPLWFKKEEEEELKAKKNLAVKMWTRVVAGMKSKWFWIIVCLLLFIICEEVLLPEEEKDPTPNKSLLEYVIEWYNCI